MLMIISFLIFFPSLPTSFVLICVYNQKQGDKFDELADDHPIQKWILTERQGMGTTLEEVFSQSQKRKLMALRAFVRAQANSKKPKGAENNDLAKVSHRKGTPKISPEPVSAGSTEAFEVDVGATPQTKDEENG